MGARGILITLAVTLAASLGAPTVRAQEPGEDARTLFDRGQAAYSQGDYDAAIASWGRAYELDPRPRLQLNLSQAYERLGRLEDAITAVDLYLERADPGDPHQADARARLAALRERVGRTSVRVTGGPEGATILIDGQDHGRTPRPDPIPVTPGSHRVVVRAAGFDDHVSTVVVPAGQSVEVALELRPAQRPEELPIVPIALFSVGGVALVAGAVLGGVALSEAGSAPGRESPEADAARGLALGADITMAVGVACAAAGLIVLLVGGEQEGERAPERISLAPWGGPSGGGLSLAGHF
jgi:tetratricopeptide (TPR) repeat protein